MAWRFRRKVNLAPGVSINISKSGISTSIGPKGLTTNVKAGRRSKTTATMAGVSESITHGKPTRGRRTKAGASNGNLAGLVVLGFILYAAYVIFV